MVDTLMVLWTRGIRNRFLQAVITFLLLFASICVMLFLVTASGVRLPGLAVTATLPAAASPTATPRPVPGDIVPIILQNPMPPVASPTFSTENRGWNRYTSSAPAVTRPPDTPTPTAIPTPDEPSFFP